MSAGDVIAIYLRAAAVLPSRAEARHGASRYASLNKMFKEGYEIATPAIDLAAPADGRFVERWIYECGLLDEYAVNAYWAGRFSKSLDACLELMARNTMPEGQGERIVSNARLAIEKLPQEPNLGSVGAESPTDPHALKPARRLRPRIVGAPRVLVPKLVKQKEQEVPFSVLAPVPQGFGVANPFTELSQTIFYGLQRLGYHARIVSQLSEADGQIIVVGANILSNDEAMHLPAGTVIYNAEPVPEVWHQFPGYAKLLRRHKVWDYSLENAKRLSASLGKVVEYVPLGYVPELTRIEKMDHEDIDVLFYGTVNARRETVLRRLEAAGLETKRLWGVYGVERDAWIARSKVVLNMHSYVPGVLEILRVAYLLQNAKAVVAECNPGESVDTGLLPGVVAAKYDDLVEACASLVADHARRRALEQAGFDAFRARSKPISWRTRSRRWRPRRRSGCA